MKKIYTFLICLSFASFLAKGQTIFDIQTPGVSMGDTSQYFGQNVSTGGIVTALKGNGYVIQDGAGAWNGIFVFDSGNTPSLGDSVTLNADVDEYFGLTELKNVTSYNVASTGNNLPAATVLSTMAVNDEQYESVLVQVTNAQAMTLPNGFGEWDVNDGSGVLVIDDAMYPYTPVVSNNYDITGIVDYAFSIFNLEPRDANDIVGTPGGPNLVSIMDIQTPGVSMGDTSQYYNQTIMTKGVVTGVVTFGAPGTFFIQDGNGAWNGIYVFESGTAVSRGDSVEVSATVTEFNGVTELVSVTNITVLNSGNSLPTPSVISTNNAATMEEYEGVLVQLLNAEYTNNPGSFGLWEVNDGSGMVECDDDIFPYASTGTVGTFYDIVGIGHFSFGTRKVLPRDINDISISTGLEEFGVGSSFVYPNPTSDILNFSLSVKNASISILDVTGKVVKTVNTNSNIVSVNVSNLTNGLYFYNVISKGETILTNRFIVAK